MYGMPVSRETCERLLAESLRITWSVVMNEDYPHIDIPVKRHIANEFPDSVGVPPRPTLKDILARNLKARMNVNPAIRTQPQLALRSGVAQSFISGILKGRNAASLDTIERLARACGCQAWELLVDGEDLRREAIERFLDPRARQ